MRSILKRYQLLLFVVLTFVISWFPWYAGIGPETMTMGPSIAAFIVVLITSGKSGLTELVRPFGRWRVKPGIWLVALFGPALLYGAGLGMHLLFGGAPHPFTMITKELHLLPLYLVIVVLMPWNGPVGEEFGWRGYALPRLQTRFSPLLASLLIGVIWGIWHLPSMFAAQDVIGAIAKEIGIIFLLPYTLGTIANSIFMTWLYNKSKASALVAGIVWHAAINFWAPVLLSGSSLVAAQQGTELPTIGTNLYLTVLFTQVIGATILVLATKGKLGFSQSKS